MSSKFLLNPGPTNTRLRTRYAQFKGSDVCHRTPDFYGILDETKHLLLNRFKTNGKFDIALIGGSGTTAMEAMISSLVSDKITVINAGIYGQRAIDMMKIYNIDYREVKCRDFVDLKPNKKYKNIYFVENETTTGEEFELGRMCELYPNAKFFMDSTSAFGASDYSGLTERISAISFCSNKCLQSTPGLGVVIWNSKLTLYKRSYYCDLEKYIGKDIAFTLPVQSVYALNKTLKISTDNKNVFDRRADMLIVELQKIGIECLNIHPSNSIIGFKHPKMSYEELRDYLYERDIVIYAGINGIDNSFRLSTMSNLFDKNFKKLMRLFRGSCLR